MSEVQRPSYTGKKIHHSDDFELCYLRHMYLRRSKVNPTAADMEPYNKILKRVAYSQFFVYSPIFMAVSMAEDDLASIGMVHLVSYINLFAIQVDKERFEKFIVAFARKNFREPNELDILSKNKADFTLFLNQRMTDIVRVCSLKASNITGKQMHEYFPFYGKSYPKKISLLLIVKYESMGYKRIDRLSYRAAKNRAKVKQDRPFQLDGNWYFVVVNEKSPLNYGEMINSGANPYEGLHHLNPEQTFQHNDEQNQWHKKSLQFDSDPVDNRIKVIANFIETNKSDPVFKQEVRTARRVLKELQLKWTQSTLSLIAGKTTLEAESLSLKSEQTTIATS